MAAAHLARRPRDCSGRGVRVQREKKWRERRNQERPIYLGNGHHGTGTCRPLDEIFSAVPLYFPFSGN